MMRNMRALLFFHSCQWLLVKQGISLQVLWDVNILIAVLKEQYLTTWLSILISLSAVSISLYLSSPITSTKVTITLLAKIICFWKIGIYLTSPHFRPETTASTECSSAFIFISSSNQNCFIDSAGSAIPLVSTTTLRTGVLAMMYSIAAMRSVLSVEKCT